MKTRFSKIKGVMEELEKLVREQVGLPIPAIVGKKRCREALENDLGNRDTETIGRAFGFAWEKFILSLKEAGVGSKKDLKDCDWHVCTAYRYLREREAKVAAAPLPLSPPSRCSLFATRFMGMNTKVKIQIHK